MPKPPAPVVVAITGASGAPYAVRLLEILANYHVPTWLLVSAHGWRLMAEECGIKDEAGLKKATGGDWASIRSFNDADRGAEAASGSVQTRGMVVCPCSMGTMAAIAHGTSRSLIERAADVTLKESRKLVLVPRETPLSLVHLRNMTLAGEAGARWEGHAGATRFYTELLGAIPDIHFDLQQIVIGPQGVCEEAKVTGTQKGRWLSHPATGAEVEFRVVIFFPWDPRIKKFKGERVFLWSLSP